MKALAWFTAAILAGGAPLNAQDLTVVEAGRSPFVITTPAEPSLEETTAAEWLAELLARCTGATLAIRRENAAETPDYQFLVGDTAAARAAGIDVRELPAEAWRIQTTGGSIILAGGRPRGTIYAVTEFLETQVGVLLLDPFTQTVPSLERLALPPLDLAGRPAFGVRALFTGFPYGNPAGGGVLGEKYRVWNRNTIDGRPAVGDHARMAPTGVHSFGQFISASEFGATHPEYFGMNAEGQRVTDDRGVPSAWTQLCVTNADVRRITVERARAFLRADRAAAQEERREPARWLVLSQNDNTQNLCLCPECGAVAEREGSESGPLLEFVNYVARELRAEFPDVAVLTEAYNFTLAAPRSVRPESNVVVRFCDNYGFSDPTRPLQDPRNARPGGLFQGWRERECSLAVWDYWRVFQQHPPGLFAPSSNVRAVPADLRLFREASVSLLTVECEDLFGAGVNDDPISADLQSFMPLRTWVGLKLMVDPDRDLDELLATFCRGYYGPAAEPMQQLLALIEDRQAALPVRIVDVPRHVWLEQLCDAEFFRQAFQSLDAALQAASADPLAQTRVRRERIVIDAAYLWSEARVRRQAGAQAIAWPPRAEVLARQRGDWQAYLATVFDAQGLALAWPIVEVGLDLAERLQLEDTRGEHVALPLTEADVELDGNLDEAFWRRATVSRLLPRNPAQADERPATLRLGWTSDALYVGIEQPAAQAAASLGVALHAADRQGVQLTLYAPWRTGLLPLNAYPYEYDEAGGLRSVARRELASEARAQVGAEGATFELRFAWSDLVAAPAPAVDATRRFVLNVESYPTAEASVPSHVSSPWLIGASPTWHSGYFQTLRLDAPAGSNP